MIKYFSFSIAILLMFAAEYTYSQQGGKHVYEFMNISNSARVIALGSNYAIIDDDDLALVYSNPALITDKMHHQISIDYIDYFSDISSGLVSYGHNIKKIGTIVTSLQFASYGEFDLMDNNGQKTGEFRASEYAFIIGWSKPLSEKLRIGANLKNIFSSLETYNSYGLAADVALSYSDREKGISSSFLIKNIGRQITTYTDENNESIPFQIQLGLAKKFEHAPFRLLFLLNNLQTWNLRYDDPSSKSDIDSFSGKKIEEDKYANFGDNALRHLALGLEFLPGKGNFMVRLGYNYRRQREMKIASRTALVGFSFGFGIKVYNFKISYSRASYHLAGGTNTISIGTNFDDLFKSKEND